MEPVLAFLSRLLAAFAKLLGARPLDPLPILRDISRYSPAAFKSDARAGLNVALLAIPQGMAYAVIAEVPIYFGITCSAAAAMAAAPFSGSRHTILGPTNATAFMVFGFFSTLPDTAPKATLLPLLVFLVGMLLVIGAYFRVADLIQYVSRSVVVGYVTGAAVLIVANQARQILGIDFGPEDSRPRTFFGILTFLYGSLQEARWEPMIVAASTAAGFLALSRRKPRWPSFAMVLTAVSVAYAVLRSAGFTVETFEAFTLSNLGPQVPRFSDFGLFHDIHLLFGIALSVAFLAALENSVMSKTLAARSGDRPDQNQDLLGLGIANLVTSFFSALPASGSLTRSQLNYASGAETRLAGVYCGLLCAVGALFLAWPGWSVITWIPKSALAALVVCVAASLIHRRQIRICLAATRSDAAVTSTTFLATLVLPFHQAIFLGVGISILLYLRKASRPDLVEYDFTDEGEVRESVDGARRHPLISLVHVEGELFFGAAELLRGQIQRSCSDPNLRIIILRMRNAHRLDATSVMAVEDLVRFLRSSGRHLIVSGATPDVWGVLEKSGTLGVIGRENVFAHDPRRPNWSTREALQRASVLLGSEEAEIRIFYDPNAAPPTRRE